MSNFLFSIQNDKKRWFFGVIALLWGLANYETLFSSNRSSIGLEYKYLHLIIIILLLLNTMIRNYFSWILLSVSYLIIAGMAEVFNFTEVMNFSSEKYNTIDIGIIITINSFVFVLGCVILYLVRPRI